MYCTKCGCKNSENAKFCVSCGQPLEEKQIIPITENKREKSSVKEGRHKTMLLLAGVLVLGVIVFIIWPRKVVYDFVSEYSTSGFAVGRIGEKYGVCDRERNELIPAKYDSVEIGETSQGSGLTPVKLDENITFLSSEGKEVFDEIEGTAVEDYYLVRDGRKYGSVSSTGAYLLECKYKKLELEERHDDRIRVKLNGKPTYVTVSGTILFDSVGEENEYGFSIAEKDGMMGYIRSNGEEIIPVQYETLRIEDMKESENLKVVMDDEISFISQDGELLYSDIGEFGANGLAAACNADGLYGYIDEAGEVLTEFMYTEVGDFGTHTLARVKSGDQWGYINELGVTVIIPMYKDAEDFNEEGRALVQYFSEYNFVTESGAEEYEYVGDFINDVAIAKRDGRYGLVNRDGKLLTDTWYDLIYDEETYRNAGVLRARQDGQYVLLGDDGEERSEFYDDIYCAVDEEGQNEEQQLIPFRSAGKWGMMDLRGKVVVEPVLVDIEAVDCYYNAAEFWTAYFEDGIGVINAEGKTIIKGNYDYFEIGDFTTDNFIYAYQNDKVGTYSLEGELIIPIEYDSVQSRWSDEENYYVALKKEENYALADGKGNLLTEFRYDYIGSVSEGAFVASIDGRYGVSDFSGNEIIEFAYTDIQFCANDEWGYVWVCDETEQWGSLDREGQQVIPSSYDSIQQDSDKRILAGVNGKEGIMDEKLNWIVPPEYDYISGSDLNGYYCVEKDSKYGVFDQNGNVVLPPQYDSIERNYYSEEGEEWHHIAYGEYYGIVNKDYEIVVPPEYTYAFELPGSDGLFIVESEDETESLFDKNGELLLSGAAWIGYAGTGGRIVVEWPDGETSDLYDTSGKHVETMDYDVTSIFQNGLARIYEDGLYGYINTNGERVIDCIYEDANTFSEDGIAAVSDGELWGYIDEMGNTVTDCIFSEADDFYNGSAEAVTEDGDTVEISVTGEITGSAE